MAGWFDALFEGANTTVLLSTAPWCPGTHWYQIRFLLETPLAVNAGQHLEGTLKMEANNLQSYYVRLFMQIQGTNICSEAPCIDLKDPEYRFYTSANAYCPPGFAGAWGHQNAQQGGGSVNGATMQQTPHSYQQAQCPQSHQVPPAGQAQQWSAGGGQYQTQTQQWSIGGGHHHTQAQQLSAAGGQYQAQAMQHLPCQQAQAGQPQQGVAGGGVQCGQSYNDFWMAGAAQGGSSQQQWQGTMPAPSGSNSKGSLQPAQGSSTRASIRPSLADVHGDSPSGRYRKHRPPHQTAAMGRPGGNTWHS